MSERQRRELGAFARYCAKRIERELGAIDGWTVSLVAGRPREFASVVSVISRGRALEARAIGGDPVLTMWDAMCRLEQVLRERVPRATSPQLCA